MLGELARIAAPVRRRRRPHRPRRRDVAPARLPADRGLPGRRASAARSARPATTRPARPPWSSRSTRPRRPATCAWPRSPASISGASCARSGGSRAARAALEAAAAWHRAAGGGEQAALGECLLAALDAADGVAGAEERLAAILDDARRDDDAPVEVFALDALARIAADAGDVAGARPLRGGRPADGGRLALHHRARPDRRRCGQPSARPSPRWFSTTNASSPPMTIAMPTICRSLTHLAEQQERPHDRERGLRDLGDPDRADLDRLLREHHQPVGGDAAGEREDQHVGPAGAAHPEHVAVGDRERQHRHAPRSGRSSP